jgi:hypothetical protein
MDGIVRARSRYGSTAPGNSTSALTSRTSSEVVAGERLVRTFEFEAHPAHVPLETVPFEEIDGVTELTSTTCFSLLSFGTIWHPKWRLGLRMQ